MHYYAPVQQPDSCQSFREYHTSKQVTNCRSPGLGCTLPLTPGLVGRARHSVRAVTAQNWQKPSVLRVAGVAH